MSYRQRVYRKNLTNYEKGQVRKFTKGWSHEKKIRVNRLVRSLKR